MSFTQFQREALAAHNSSRAKHRCPNLVLDQSLCNYSQEWANYLVQIDTLQHRPSSPYGENLYFYGTSNADYQMKGNQPVDAWYSEISKYVFGLEQYQPEAGHFTQVVWKSSQRLGVAIATNNRGRFFIVANYSPPGNVIGSFVANVPRPIK